MNNDNDNTTEQLIPFRCATMQSIIIKGTYDHFKQKSARDTTGTEARRYAQGLREWGGEAGAIVADYVEFAGAKLDEWTDEEG